MAKDISQWRVDESIRESSVVDSGREFPEYIDGQSTPATKTYAGYVSPDESTIIAVSELNRPGDPEATDLFIYLYEVASGRDKAPFWMFSGHDGVEATRELARELVGARDEIPAAPTEVGFLSELRDRVPGLTVHTAYTADDYDAGWVEEHDIEFEHLEPTGHPLESYLPGYVVGIQFQKFWPCLDCEEPGCSAEIEGANQSSWEPSSTLYLGETEAGVIIPTGWRCKEHPTESLDPFMEQLPAPDIVSEWETRMDEERRLIDERVEALTDAGAFDDDPDETGENVRDMQRRRRARQELEAEGVLEEYSQAEQEERAEARAILMGPSIDRYYLVRCDIDCMCFGGYYQNLSYIREPVVVDEREYT